MAFHKLLRTLQIKRPILVLGFMLLPVAITGCGGDSSSETAASSSSDSGSGASAGAPMPGMPSQPSAASSDGNSGTPSGGAGGAPGGMPGMASGPGGAPGGMPGMASGPGGAPGGMPGMASGPGGAPGGMPGMASGPGGAPGGMPGMASGPGGAPGGMPGMAGGDGGVLGGGYTPPAEGGAPGGFPGGQPPQLTSRPSDYSEWNDDHFKDAVRERDQKVLEAIDQRVKAKPNDAEVAKLLASLLVVSTEAPSSPATGAGNGLGPGSGIPGGMPASSGPQMGAPGSGLPTRGPTGAGAGAGGGAGLPSRGPTGASAGAGGGAGAAPPAGTWYRPEVPETDRRELSSTDESSEWMKASQQLQATSNQVRPVIMDSLTAMILEASVSYIQPPGAPGGLGGPGFQPGQPQQGSPNPGSAGTALNGGFQPGQPQQGSPNPGAAGTSGFGGGANVPSLDGGDPSEMGGGAPGMMGAGGFPGGVPQVGNLSSRELVQHIVDGLLANGTPDAWATLHGLLTDQVTSALPGSEATEIVIISLIREMETKPEPVEKTLLSILDGSAPLPPANRSAALKTLAAVSAAASNQLTKLGPTTVALPSGGGASSPASGGMASGLGGGLGGGMGAGMPPGMGMGLGSGMDPRAGGGGGMLGGAPGMAGPGAGAPGLGSGMDPRAGGGGGMIGGAPGMAGPGAGAPGLGSGMDPRAGGGGGMIGGAPGMAGPGAGAPGLGSGMDPRAGGGGGMIGGAPGMAGPGAGAPALGSGMDPRAGGGGGMLGGAPGMGMPADGFDGGMGAGAPGGFNGLAGNPVANMSSSITLDGAVLFRAAVFLWKPATVDVIAAQLQTAPDLTTATDLITLAAAIPTARTRHGIFEAMSRNHGAGADPLTSSGLFSMHSPDPALLVVLKTLPRQRPTPPQRNAPATAPTMDSWTIASQQMVYSLRDRLRATAGAHTTTKTGAPLRLHRNAVPEVNVVMVMPGDAKQFLGDSSPGETKVYYARTTFTPANAKEQQQVLEHYTDRSAGISHPDMQQQLMWIDGVKSTEDGLRRTMDVIIQQTQAAAAPGAGGGLGGGFGGGAGPPSLDGGPSGGPAGGAGGGFTGGTYSIEVIVVETQDPKGITGAGLTTSTGK